MKKSLCFGMFAAAGLLLATSCQTDELETTLESGGEATVSFTLKQPGISTRTYSDGKTATCLTYAIYEAGETEVLITNLNNTEKAVTFNEDLTATVSVRLVTGKSYDIIFWADCGDDSPYTFNASAGEDGTEAQTITVAYPEGGTPSQDENRDAFFAAVTDLTVNGTVDETVELTRPFAQLNIGTTDSAEATAAGFTPTKSQVTVADVYTTLNLKTGDVVGEAQEVTYEMAAIPTSEDGDFPVEDVTYLAMNYLLVAEDKALTDVTFAVTDDTQSNTIDREYTNVPVQRNYRTNIYGNLLTDPADFTIEIKPAYDDISNYILGGADALQYVAANGGTASLTGNVVLSEPLEIADEVEAVIYLNGYSITYSSGASVGGAKRLSTKSEETTGVIEVTGGLTIYGAGKVVGDSESSLYAVCVESDASLTINGGTYYGGLYIADGSTVSITGGTFYDSFDPTDFVADGYACVQVGDTYFVGEEADDGSVTIADGVVVSEVDDAAVYSISTADGMFWVAEQVNGAHTNFAGETIQLANNIDLENAAWTPIGSLPEGHSLADSDGTTYYKTYAFAGTFDGNSCTISNLNASSSEATGLFGCIADACVIKDLTIDGATITSNHWAGAIAGYYYQMSYTSTETMTISGCTVTNSSVTASAELVGDEYDNGDKAGGIIGLMISYSTTASVTGCTVSNTNITAYRDLGGLIGTAFGYQPNGTDVLTVTNNTVSSVTIKVDAEHNYKSYKNSDDYDAGTFIGDNTGSEIDLSTNTSSSVTLDVPKNVATVATAAELAEMLNTYTDSGSGNNTVNITSDIVLSEAWTSVKVEGYTGAGVITVNGGGHTISGLTAALFAGGFAGTSGIVINDLTIDASEIVYVDPSTGKSGGGGAFINTIDSMPTITLNNCHVTNSSITSDSRAGGLIGWNSGYSNENDGAVKTYVTITDCSVENCTITGDGTVGGIVGHAGASTYTWNTIENCDVTDCTLISYDTSYRVGGIVGTANIGTVVINDCTMDGTTVTQINTKTSAAITYVDSYGDLGRDTDYGKYAYYYGRIAFSSGNGSLTIDNISITHN